MGKYLDPKADLTFKKVFGERQRVGDQGSGMHKHLVISLLNAMLPLKDDECIESIEYWPAEKIPDRTEVEKSEQAEAKKEQAEAKAEQAEAKMEQAEAKAEQAEAKLKQKDIDTARKMKALGSDTAFISQVTGLTAKQIEAL